MKDTWRQLFRRLAAGCIVSGSLATSSAMCYAVQLAYDTASDAAYADGWQTGDNGGTGFTAWNFDSRYGNGTNYTITGVGIDDGLHAGSQLSNPHNNIGHIDSPPSLNDHTWAIFSTPTNTGAPHIGRGFPALQPNQTLSVVLDNPTRRQFFKGYHVMLNGNTGGVNGNRCNPTGNACSPGATPVNKFAWWRFEYFDYGVWKVGDGNPVNGGDFPTSNPALYDTDTAAGGMRLDFTLTGADAYSLTVTPLANPSNAYTHSGPLRNPGTSIDWIEFVFYNPLTDTTPTLAEPQTDLYIRSMQITGPGVVGVEGDYNGNGVVDAADFVLWRNGGPLQNEVDTPGTINAADYTAWRARFGNPAGSGSGQTGASVPEPGAFVYFVAAIGSLAAVRNRKRP